MSTTALALCSRAYLMVGKAATMRWLFVILSPSKGTLKSTRISTRLSVRSTSVIASLVDRDMMVAES